MYSVIAQQLGHNTSIIEGTILVANYLAWVLLDTNATHSFISHKFADMIDVASMKYNIHMHVFTRCYCGYWWEKFVR